MVQQGHQVYREEMVGTEPTANLVNLVNAVILLLRTKLFSTFLPNNALAKRQQAILDQRVLKVLTDHPVMEELREATGKPENRDLVVRKVKMENPANLV